MHKILEFKIFFKLVIFHNFHHFHCIQYSTFNNSWHNFINSNFLNISPISFELYLSFHQLLALYSHEGTSLFCVLDCVDYHCPEKMGLGQTYLLGQCFLFSFLKDGVGVNNSFLWGRGGGMRRRLSSKAGIALEVITTFG